MRGKRVVKSSSSAAPNNSTQSYSVMNRIMLRFRPIAPKPPGGENLSDAADLEKRNGSVKRTKRKYVRVRCRQSRTKKSENPVAEELLSPSSENRFVTLQLLPERSDSERICNSDNMIIHEKNDEVSAELGGGTAEMCRFRSGIESWIVVECVTETGTGGGVGFTDLEKDTCPGFVSDGSNKVVWINEAYRKMVKAEGGVEVTVWLIVKEILPRFCLSFACRVRLVQHSGQGHKWNRIVPCDVYRLMDFQGFAWKLDVNTALSL